MLNITVHNFAEWRGVARRLVREGVNPRDVDFRDHRSQPSLFEGSAPAPTDEIMSASTAESLQDTARTGGLHVPRKYISLATTISCHRDPARWNLLYRVLWRILHGERALLAITIDDDVMSLMNMEKQVRRDAHKMKAFVRFRKAEIKGEEHFLAWHRPDHYVTRKVAPFFSRRFKGMKWTILTPDESVSWDLHTLSYGPGVARNTDPRSDELESLWATYYENIFNPARIKLKMMKSEMPVRHWETLPETRSIARMLQDAPGRVQHMIEHMEGYGGTAEDVISKLHDAYSIEALREAASKCMACDLYQGATQTVFGQGPLTAKIVLVGEQPGDHEDIHGVPFVGPAGNVLLEALARAGMERSEVYITNIVKHFKHTVASVGKAPMRLHKRPDAREVRACRPWFDAEWRLLTNAQILICLGATAAKTLLGPSSMVTRDRGRLLESRYSQKTIVTWHPSAILRAPTDSGNIKFQQLIDDLTLANREVAN